MGAFWKYTTIVLAGLAILGGSLLTMGHLRSQEADYTQSELAKLKAMSSAWEMKMTALRAAFREQVWRYDLSPMIDHPEDWADWRAEEKLRNLELDRSREYGAFRGVGFLMADGMIHAAIGDTSDLRAAISTFKEHGNPDLIVSENQPGHSGYVAVRFTAAASDQSPRPGEIIALYDRKSVLTVPDSPPASWILMDGPKRPLYASSATLNVPFQKATWSILMSEKSGIAPYNDGNHFGFCRVQVPGMYPMLLLTEIRTPSSSADAMGAMALIAGGALLLALMLSSISRRPRANATATEETEQAAANDETVSFRQIFQAAQQPLCVIDSHGRLMRINSMGRTLLHVRKGGKSDPALMVTMEDGEKTIGDFLEALSHDVNFCEEIFTLTLNGESVFEGSVEATRLYTVRDGHGPVLLEFTESQAADAPVAPETAEPAENQEFADDYNPDPVILVGDDGIIRDYNEAAIERCVRIKDTPLLADLLPGIERRDLQNVLGRTVDCRFDSLFGSAVHEFRAIRTENGILLYGHEKTDTRTLKIALEQAQENFNSLCSLTPSAVLLIDPRTHRILQVNAGATELFGLTPFELQEKSLDDFTEISWEEPISQKDILLTLGDESSLMCRFDHDLIKIEGEPTVLAVMAPLHLSLESDIRGLADQAQAMAGALQENLTEEPAPPGPGLLIVNNPTVREVTRRMLERTGHSCETFSTLDDATAWLYSHELTPELVCLDLGDFDEVDEWLTMLRTRYGDVPCLALSGGNDSALRESGLNRCLEKPFELTSFKQALLDLQLEAEIENTG